MHQFCSETHIALGVTLIALAAGVFLMIKSHAAEGCCGAKIVGKIFGVIIVLTSLLSIACLGYHCYKGCSTQQCHKMKGMNGMTGINGMPGMPWNHPPITAPAGAAPAEPETK